ncbi:hypothetical protein [Parahaliea aestuarii]|nr:hypothetical protein [Parahaliea aestuarii]
MRKNQVKDSGGEEKGKINEVADKASSNKSTEHKGDAGKRGSTRKQAK